MHLRENLIRFIAAFLGVLALTGAAHGQQEILIPRLQPGEDVSGSLIWSHTASFALPISAGEYIKVEIEKNGVDLTIELVGPDGSEQQKSISPEYQSQLSIGVIGKSTGSYRLNLSSVDPIESNYSIRISVARVATPLDERQVAAERAFAQAEQLQTDSSQQELSVRLAAHKLSLELWSEAGGNTEEARAYSRIGSIYLGLNDRQQAREYFLQALFLNRGLGDRQLEAATLLGLGDAWILSEPQTGLEYYQSALSLFRELKDRRGEAYTLEALGKYHLIVNDTTKAEESFIQALALSRATGQRLLEDALILGLAGCYLEADDLEKAKETYGQSLDLALELKNRRYEAAARSGMAITYDTLGEIQKALDAYVLALTVQREIGDSRGEATTLMDLGEVYRKLGQYDKGLDSFREALPIWQKVQDRFFEAETLTRMGSIYLGQNQPSKALECQQKALPLHQSLSDRFGEASTIADMGETYALMGQPQKASLYYEQALPLFQALKSVIGEGDLLVALGSSSLSLGRNDEAMEYLNRALALFRQTPFPYSEAEALFELARVQSATGHQLEAVGSVNASLDIAEHILGSVAGADAHTSYSTTIRERYELLIALLMESDHTSPEEGFAARALETSERARARGLLDLLREARADIREGVEPQLLERERFLQKLLSQKASDRVQLLSNEHTDQQAADLDKEINRLVSEYEATEAEIRSHSPRYAGLTQPQPLTASQIQQLLDPETVLLEFSIGEEQSFMWLVSQDSIQGFKLPKRAEIEVVARHAYDELRLDDSSGGGPSTARLSRLLLGPVANQIAAKRLVIVADGALQYIPFAALRMPNKELMIARHEIVELPSIASLALLRQSIEARVPVPKRVAVFADPVFSADDPRVTHKNDGRSSTMATPADLERSAKESGVLRFYRLQGSRREAETIVKLAGDGATLEAVDFDANREKAISPELGQFRIVHFASHTLLNNVHPELSGIVLSLVDSAGLPQNGFLQVHEIFNLKLNADLVVLSSCQSALGKEIRGEGLVGMTRAFMYAGTPRVLASLWKVPDSATAQLMSQFYRAMFVEGRTPSSALREAQLALAKQKRWSSPYYWAGFVLQGEWK